MEDKIKNKIGIYSATHNNDTDQFAENLNVGDKPGFIIIGFFGSHWPGSPEDPYGFVGYVITNAEDKGGATESLVWVDYDNCRHTVWVLGDAAIDDEGVDYCAVFKENYPSEFSAIIALRDEYFSWENQGDNPHLVVLKPISDDIRLSKIFPGNALDLEDVKKSNGASLGYYVEL